MDSDYKDTKEPLFLQSFPVPSPADRDSLRKLGQELSRVISGRTAIVVEFGPYD